MLTRCCPHCPHFQEKGYDPFDALMGLWESVKRFQPDKVRHFLEGGADVRHDNGYVLSLSTTFRRESPFKDENQLKVIQILIDYGVDINSGKVKSGKNGKNRILIQALKDRDLELILLLLRNKIDYDGSDERLLLKKILMVDKLPKTREELIDMLDVAVSWENFP